MARPSSAARRYAEAAFQLADRDDALDAWAEGLDLAAGVLADPRIQAVVANPARPLRDRLAVVEGMLKGKTSDGVVKLVSLLVERGRTDRLAVVASEYHQLLNRRRGIVEARVTSAAPLSKDETEAVRRWVADYTDKTVNLTVGVDDSLIGGLTVRVGDTLLDASVRGRLERLRNQLVAGVRR
jgi:F-type H+-transporting ATPase subunit delta